MTNLTNAERGRLAGMLEARKPVLREEIRAGLLRMQAEGYEELLSGTSDEADRALAKRLTNIANADVARDAEEMQDIISAKGRLANGTYGICIDCGKPIPYERLVAYPTAKRCLQCQQAHEAKRTSDQSRS